MNTLIISGSPRKEGNTETLLSFLEKELINHSISANFISLSGKNIKIVYIVTDVMKLIVVFKMMILIIYTSQF